jgi:regulator of replication initiation timing
MTTPKLARHIAKRIETTSDATSQNAADTLRALADQVDALARGAELMNAECTRLIKERDELRLEVAALKTQKLDRRTQRRTG